MTQDTWAYVTCNAGRVEYSIFDARDTRVAHREVALSDFGPHEPKDVLRSLDVSFVVLDGAFAGQRVTCPASLAAPIEIGGQFARMARFIDNSAPDQCFAHTAALGAFVADHAKWDGIVVLAGPVTTWAHVSAGELISFRSSLALKMACDVMRDRGLDTPDQVGDMFIDAVSSGLSNPESVFSKLSASVGGRNPFGPCVGRGFGGLSFLLVGTGYRHFRRGGCGALDRSRLEIAIRDGTARSTGLFWPVAPVPCARM